MPSPAALSNLGRLSRLVVLLVVCGGMWSPADAQNVTEVALKGAFLFNFVRFATWPADALPSSPTLSACVVGDRAVGEAFTKAVMGRPLDGRTVVVSIIEPGLAMPACHVLYLSGLPRTQVAQIITAQRETPVLTVSDLDGFAAMGGIVEVFVETGKMKFRVNPKSAKRSRVQISSRLLVLADLVEESPRQPESGPARAFTPPRTNKSLFRREPVLGIGWGAFGDPVGAALR
jgi:hypothetical protein